MANAQLEIIRVGIESHALAELQFSKLLAPVVSAYPGAMNEQSMAAAEASTLDFDYTPNPPLVTLHVGAPGEVDASLNGASIKVFSDTGIVGIGADGSVIIAFDDDHPDAGEIERAPRVTDTCFYRNKRIISIEIDPGGSGRVNFEGSKSVPF